MLDLQNVGKDVAQRRGSHRNEAPDEDPSATAAWRPPDPEALECIGVFAMHEVLDQMYTLTLKAYDRETEM